MTTAWTHAPTLPDEAAQRLDCIQTNLALTADAFHGAGAHLRWGADSGIRVRAVEGALPTVEPTVEEHLERAHLIGLIVGDVKRRAPLAEVAARPLSEPLFVVADAFDLPWTPYAGREHLSHSLLLWPTDAGTLMIDAYDNETRHGPARAVNLPVARTGLLDSTATASHVARLGVNTFPQEAPEPRLDGTDIEAYVGAYREAAATDPQATAEAWALECWLLRRRHELAKAWRLTTGQSVDVEGSARWARACERSFIATRRVARGGAMPTATFDEVEALLQSTAGPAGDAATHRRPCGASPAAWVLLREVIEEVLGRPTTLGPDDVLTELPGLTSLGLVQVVEHLERRLNVQLAPDDMDPDVLIHPARLLEALGRGAPTTHEGAA